MWIALVVAWLPASGAELGPVEAQIDASAPMATVQVQRVRPAELTVVDCEGLSDSRKIATMFLQGLASRGAPRLYLRGLYGFNNRADDWWLERLETEYGIRHQPVTWEAALKEFGGGLGGLVRCGRRGRGSASLGAGLPAPLAPRRPP
jgi:hypothetical protein